jgi:hypothetical protein
MDDTRLMNEVQPQPTAPPTTRKKLRRMGCLLIAIVCTPILIFLAFLTVFSPPARTAITPQPLSTDFMKGISYESQRSGDFGNPASDQALSEVVVPSGANWIAVIVRCYQDNLTSTKIECLPNDKTVTDDELRHVIGQAHDLGLKVMLKPQVELSDLKNANSGRFAINFGADEAAWSTWFESYTRFTMHYAGLAQEMNAEYFVVGTELEGTVQRADEWRTLIREVRSVFDGSLTYAALTYFEPLQISWWDELDSIGIDAYFALTLTKNPTLAQMELGWSPIVEYLDLLADHWHKPITLTEVGYMSVDGTNILPGDWSLDGEIDLQEQADAYQSLFDSFEGKAWWNGVFWWSLSPDPQQGGALDRGYSFHNKPAEDVVRRYFGAAPVRKKNA